MAKAMYQPLPYVSDCYFQLISSNMEMLTCSEHLDTSSE